MARRVDQVDPHLYESPPGGSCASDVSRRACLPHRADVSARGTDRTHCEDAAVRGEFESSQDHAWRGSRVPAARREADCRRRDADQERKGFGGVRGLNYAGSGFGADACAGWGSEAAEDLSGARGSTDTGGLGVAGTAQCIGNFHREAKNCFTVFVASLVA
jgi:hypothetical protein